MTAPVDLSVVIPVYNGGDFIQETIDSIISKSSGFSVECIVVDDGSTDETPIILQSYVGKIRSVSQQNSGESSAVNSGLNSALGRYIMVLSADDPILTPKIFDGVKDFFDNNPEVVAWYPDWNIIDDKNNILQTKLLPDYSFFDLFSKNKVLPGPGTWFRAESARAIGGRSEKWKYVGDYDFWLRLSQQGKFVHRPEILAQWRKHSGSTSISERGLSMAKERTEVIDNFVEIYGQNLAPSNISLARAHAHYFAARLGFFSISVNARKLILKGIRINPRLLLSVKPYELLFMLGFPLTKNTMDLFSKYWKS